MSIESKKCLLIPAAGTATRMRGLPKFLLPTHSSKSSLLERHLEALGDFFDEILIGVNPDFSNLLKSVVGETTKIRIIELRTRTMMETVTRLCKESKLNSFTLVMPDTFFSDYEQVCNFIAKERESKPSLLCWELQSFQRGKLGQVLISDDNLIIDIQDKKMNCSYKYFWGVASFNRENLTNIRDDASHIGFMYENLIKNSIKVNGIKVSGFYYDCGTQEEYIKMLLDSQH